MGVFGFLKKTFLPTKQEGMERRLSAFGTTSIVPVVATAIVAGAAVGLAGAGGLVAGAAKAVPSIVKAVIPKSAIGKVAAVTLAVPVAVSVAKQPIATAKSIFKLESGLTNVATNTLGLVNEPSIAKAKELVIENPIIVGALGAGAALLLGKGALLTAAALKTLGDDNKMSIGDFTIQEPKVPKEKTQVPKVPKEKTQVPKVPKEAEVPATTPTPKSPELPVTPSTEVLTAGTTTKRRTRARRQTKIEPTRINQHVNIAIQTKSTGISANKRYLNREVLYN
jgi:hypothetical protein